MFGYVRKCISKDRNVLHILNVYNRIKHKKMFAQEEGKYACADFD